MEKIIFTRKADLDVINHYSYKFDRDDHTHIDWEAVNRNPDNPEDHNWMMKEVDAFFDRCDWVCAGSDGHDYLVRFDTVTKVPMVWHRVYLDVECTDYKALFADAVAHMSDSFADITAEILAEWTHRFDSSRWNGECYDMGQGYFLYPRYDVPEDFDWDNFDEIPSECIHYEVRRG